MKEEKKLIWILEDDAGARFVYEESLSLRYHLRFFCDLKTLEQALSSQEEAPALLVADLRLPGESFLSFLNSLEERQLRLPFPFLIVSSVDDLDVLRFCFSKGAVDYLTKPFGKGELIVKIERLFAQSLEKHTPSEDQELPIEIDPIHLVVRFREQSSAPLTSRELQLVSALKQFQNKTVSREDLVREVWGETQVSPNAIDVHLSNLRKKIAALGLEIRYKPPRFYTLKQEGG